MGRFGLALAGGSGVAEVVSEGLLLRPGLKLAGESLKTLNTFFSSGQKVTSGSRRGWILRRFGLAPAGGSGVAEAVSDGLLLRPGA